MAIALKGREKLVNFLFRNINKKTKKSPNDRSSAHTQLPSLGKVSHSLVSRNWRPSSRSLQEIGMPECLVDLCKVCWARDERDRPSFNEIQEYLEIDVKRAIMEEVEREALTLGGANSPEGSATPEQMARLLAATTPGNGTSSGRRGSTR